MADCAPAGSVLSLHPNCGAPRSRPAKVEPCHQSRFSFGQKCGSASALSQSRIMPWRAERTVCGSRRETPLSRYKYLGQFPAAKYRHQLLLLPSASLSLYRYFSNGGQTLAARLPVVQLIARTSLSDLKYLL